MDLRASVFVKGPKSKLAYEKILASSRKVPKKDKIRAERAVSLKIKWYLQIKIFLQLMIFLII